MELLSYQVSQKASNSFKDNTSSNYSINNGLQKFLPFLMDPLQVSKFNNINYYLNLLKTLGSLANLK